MTPPFLPATGESEIIILTGQPVSQVGKLKKKQTGAKKGSKNRGGNRAGSMKGLTRPVNAWI